VRAAGAGRRSSRRCRQQHYLFEVLNLLRWPRIELNVGVGEGLTAASNPFVVKMILGVQ
jgi:hypothetical protein